MSVLGTIVYLEDFPYFDRYGERIEPYESQVHLATTDSKYVHLSLFRYNGKSTYVQDVQLDVEQALQLGEGLVKWATLERERQEKAGRK